MINHETLTQAGYKWHLNAAKIGIQGGLVGIWIKPIIDDIGVKCNIEVHEHIFAEMYDKAIKRYNFAIKFIGISGTPFNIDFTPLQDDGVNTNFDFIHGYTSEIFDVMGCRYIQVFNDDTTATECEHE